MFVFPNNGQDRIVEAFVGEYASGKSEAAINRALELFSAGQSVTLVDLDTVEPFYTIRPLKEALIAKGLNVISFSRSDSFGLGETGAMLHPQARWTLMHEGSLIIDVGYGVHGIRTLNLIEGAYESPELEIVAVINSCRPMTNSVSKIVDYIKELGRIDAIVANAHLGDETTVKDVINGNMIITRAADILNIPVKYAGVDEKLRDEISKIDLSWRIKYFTRYMPQAMW
ncbi:MAG: hypothetical protein LBR98_09625 [Syntrophomonadaceae bacterium]|nr:hypothetical protein [Syntrophomonadaceae bacterium]